MAFYSDRCELHMGILQNQLADIKAKMNAAAARVSMAEDPNSNVKGLDLELEKLTFEQHNKDYDATQKRLRAYENKVLELTELE